MPARARLARSIARVEALPLPWRPSLPHVRPRAWLADVAPTRRSLAIGFAVLAVALGGYLIARESPLFAIDRIKVSGGSPQVARQVHSALASLVGRPLVGLDGSAVLQKVDALPTVVSASYDRAFPHTLRITVVPERPAAVLRRGSDSWLVSMRGRVMERLPATALPKLPRIWISTRTSVRTGAELTAAGAATAAHAVGLAGTFAARIGSASLRRRSARVPSSLGRGGLARGRGRHQAQGRGGRTGARRAAVGLDVRRRQQPGPPGLWDRSAGVFLTTSSSRG